ncbi:MAG: hypothetical protein WDN03_09090 [Rhizomicrobium sp.]
MKLHTMAAVAFAGALALLTPTIAGAAPQDFNLTNSTGYEIKSVFISPHSSNDWQEDVLGQDTLADGGAVEIHFPGGRGATCDWDLKVVYSTDDSSAEWTDGFDLCTITQIDIKWDGHTTSATYQ